jgi:hypothetical protein
MDNSTCIISGRANDTSDLAALDTLECSRCRTCSRAVMAARRFAVASFSPSSRDSSASLDAATRASNVSSTCCFAFSTCETTNDAVYAPGYPRWQHEGICSAGTVTNCSEWWMKPRLYLCAPDNQSVLQTTFELGPKRSVTAHSGGPVHKKSKLDSTRHLYDDGMLHMLNHSKHNNLNVSPTWHLPDTCCPWAAYSLDAAGM